MGSNKLMCVYRVIATLGLVYCVLLAKHVILSLPLSTSSQWIIDEPSGSRVKLACVNWASHLTPMLAEGLHLHPLDTIAHTIASWGFNCVRLTWATSMFTNQTLAEARVAQTFKDLGLQEELQGVASSNGKLVGMTSLEAFKEVVAALGREGLMVVLDYCARMPGWDCGNADENLRDGSYEAQTWLQGLQTVASVFKGWPNVVGISFRFEPKGAQDWYRQMQRGAEAIHDKNADLLVIHGGLNNKNDFRLLAEQPLSDTLKRKVLYEIQFAHSDAIMEGAVGARCQAAIEEMRENVGFLTTLNMSYTTPLIGVDQRGSGLSAHDAPCFLAFLVLGDMNWAAWPLQGSYYTRGGVRDDDEKLGLFNHQWNAPRNAPLLQKLQALQFPFIQDLRGRARKVLFHPASGLCVNKVNVKELEMHSCKEASGWKFTPQGLIALDSTYLVLSAQGPAQPAVLALQGMQSNGPWTLLNNDSSQYMQISTVLSGQTLCLDAPSPPNILTNPCICSDTSTSLHPGQQPCQNSPTSQWFIFISSTSN